MTVDEVISRAKYVAIDFEFTGLNKDMDKIIEPGFVFLDDDFIILGTYQTLINPGRDTGQVDIHHITNEMVEGQPTFKEIADEISCMIDGKIIAGINTNLDLICLDRALAECNYTFLEGKSIDLVPIVCDPLFHDDERYANALTEAINSQEVEHRALPDAMVVALILPYAMEFIEKHPERFPGSFKPASVKSMSYSAIGRNIG